jgi:hypothetical protein
MEGFHRPRFMGRVRILVEKGGGRRLCDGGDGGSGGSRIVKTIL